MQSTRHCEVCSIDLKTQDRRIIVCSDYCRKIYKKQYQKEIPIELKRMYEKKYTETNKWKENKRRKNLNYRLKNWQNKISKIDLLNIKEKWTKLNSTHT